VKDKVARLVKSSMLRGSAVLWVGMMAANMSNYLFHLLMGRFLGPVNYGVLASIVSILYYLMVPTTTITTIVMKFTAEYQVEGTPGKTHSLFKRLTKQLLIVSVVLFGLMLVASPLISRFLKIESAWPMVILSFMVLGTYLLPINRGVLQGLQKFGTLSANLFLETVLKLVVGIGLVLAGYMVNGAIFGIVAAMFAAYALSFIPMRKILAAHESAAVALGSVWRYSIPVFITLFCLNSYYSIDIILVKHFLSPVEAGLYSGLSILGKIVVFASLAIVGVMFPIVAGRHKSNQKHGGILVSTLSLVTLVSGAIVIGYAAAPHLVISILFGDKFLGVAPYLGAFGLAMLLLALSTALANYFLAIDRTGGVPILVTVAIAQVILLVLFHDSLTHIVGVMLVSMAALFAALGVYYAFAVRGRPITPAAGVRQPSVNP
jgi:O-antigen/teichoic acid export membrane protein